MTSYLAAHVIPAMDLGSLAGPLLIAICLNWGMLGVLLLQTYIYYLAFPNDRLIAKVMVYSVLVLELAQTAISTYDVYAGLALEFGSEVNLDSMQKHWLTVPVFGALTGGIGQSFFAYRIWGMTGSREKGTPVIIGVLGLASFASGIGAGVTFHNAKTFTRLIEDGNNLAAIGVWNGFGSLCDIVIALCMPYYLMRQGTGLRSTHIMIVNLLTLIIETGIFTAAVAILHFCLYFIKTTAFLIPGLTISKVYGNTMLVILNNRVKHTTGREIESGDHFDLSSSSDRNKDRSVYTLPSSEGKGPRPRGTGGSIIVTKDRLVFRLDSDTPQSQAALQSVSETAEDRSVKGSENMVYGHAFGSDTDLSNMHSNNSRKV